MSKQTTAPTQGDDVAASHIPSPTEPKIVPIGFGVEKGDSVGIWVINSPYSLAHGPASKGYVTPPKGRLALDVAAVPTELLLRRRATLLNPLPLDAAGSAVVSRGVSV